MLEQLEDRCLLWVMTVVPVKSNSEPRTEIIKGGRLPPVIRPRDMAGPSPLTTFNLPGVTPSTDLLTDLLTMIGSCPSSKWSLIINSGTLIINVCSSSGAVVWPWLAGDPNWSKVPTGPKLSRIPKLMDNISNISVCTFLCDL